MNKNIKFTPLAELGEGFAEVTDNSVSIKVSGINGVLRAWLIGGEAVSLGNLVGGKLKKEIDTTANQGILITQSGRQMLIAYYQNENLKEKCPVFIEGAIWKKITDNLYPDSSLAIKYILSNRPVYESFKKYGHYYLGRQGDAEIIALACRENENPLSFLGKETRFINGYRVVCVNEKNKRIFAPEKYA